jgi:hypothetical protein
MHLLGLGIHHIDPLAVPEARGPIPEEGIRDARPIRRPVHAGDTHALVAGLPGEEWAAGIEELPWFPAAGIDPEQDSEVGQVVGEIDDVVTDEGDVSVTR